jgi:hypothetical protein
MSGRLRGAGPSSVLITEARAANVAGIDPHKRTLTAAVVDARGGVVASEHFKVSGDGHRALEAWALSFGPVARWGIENATGWGRHAAVFLAGLRRQADRPLRQGQRSGANRALNSTSLCRDPRSRLAPMSYTLLAGEFVIRYLDLPRQGPEPDGDTVKFAPDSRALGEALPRVSGRAPDINARGISVRLEAIDTLETHSPRPTRSSLAATPPATNCWTGWAFAASRSGPICPTRSSRPTRTGSAATCCRTASTATAG